MRKRHFSVVFALVFLLLITFGLFTVCEQKSGDELETPSAELNATVSDMMGGAFGYPDDPDDVFLGLLPNDLPFFTIAASWSVFNDVNGDFVGTVAYTFANLTFDSVTVGGTLTFAINLDNWVGSAVITGNLSVTGHPTIQSLSFDMTVSGNMMGSEPPAVTGRITVNGTDYDASKFDLWN